VSRARKLSIVSPELRIKEIKIMIELYGMQSPNVHKVGIMLEELGLEYQLKHVAVFRGDQFAAEFQALNPLNKVPVLIDGQRGEGRPVIESGAILIYLAETYGDLMPQTGMDRYEVLSWLMVQMSAVGPMFGQLNHFQILGEQADPYAATRYRNQCKRLYRLLDDRLAEREWIAGQSYSIADIAVFPWSRYLEQHGFAPEQHVSLVEWRSRIAKRTAVNRCIERFNEAFSKEGEETRKAATREDLDRFFGREADSPSADFSAITRS